MVSNGEKSTKRYCRCGAGVEQTAGKGDIPGFPFRDHDVIEIDEKLNIKLLKLQRTHDRLKQTSLSMLQSWRANCDVSVLVYDHDACDISFQDIAAICGYVTAYCTKGNASYQSEHNAIISLILAMEDDIMNDSNVSTVKLARHIMNSTLKDKIISR